MKAEIFIGLKPPKSELYYDLQNMISMNGGRVRLAEQLEREWLFRLPKKTYVKKYKVYRWTNKQEQIIVNNWGKVQSSKIYLLLKSCKSRKSVNQKIYNMRKKGMI